MSDLTEDDVLEAKRTLAYRLENEKYRYYEPSGKGEEFIDLVGSGENFITLYSAANGVGKTATGANILAHMIWPTGENDYFNQPLFNDFPFPKRGRIVSDPTNLEKNIIPALEDWFPAGKYERWKNKKSYFSKWKSDTGFEFDVMSYDQHPKEFEGATLGWIWFDEPPPEAIFKACISRLRKGGFIFITATPLAGSAYLYDAFAKGEYKVEIENPENGAKTEYVRKIGYVEADIESACKTHGTRGHLEHSVIESIIAEYNEDDKQARIHGKFQHLMGVIFKRFTRNIHVIKPFNINKKDFVVVEYFDGHPRNPDAVLWLAIDKDNTYYVVDELYEKVDGEEQLAADIKEKADRFRIRWRKADPSLFIANQHDRRPGEEMARSLIDRLSDIGLTYQPASKRRAESDRKIIDCLDYLELNGRLIRPPQLYFFENCRRTIWEMEHYQWGEYTGSHADQHHKKEKPMDKDDHMVENLGRAVLDEPRFIPWVVSKPAVDRKGNPNDPYATR